MQLYACVCSYLQLYSAARSSMQLYAAICSCMQLYTAKLRCRHACYANVHSCARMCSMYACSCMCKHACKHMHMHAHACIRAPPTSPCRSAHHHHPPLSPPSPPQPLCEVRNRKLHGEGYPLPPHRDEPMQNQNPLLRYEIESLWSKEFKKIR